MKAELSEKGCLVIWAENPAEAVALATWDDERLTREKSKQAFNPSKRFPQLGLLVFSYEAPRAGE